MSNQPHVSNVPVPGQANVIIQCSRCMNNVIGLFILAEVDGQRIFHATGFSLPMGIDENGVEIADKFLPGEVILCQRCLLGQEPLKEDGNAPMPKLIVPESY